MPVISIEPAYNDIPAIREIFLEYAAEANNTICFQGFSQELQALPGEYAPPEGGLYLARCDGSVAGCIAFRKLDAERCEMKRLFVRHAFRNLGLGRLLVQTVEDEARARGYAAVALTTTDSMKQAQRLYMAMDFAVRETDAASGVSYMEKSL